MLTIIWWGTWTRVAHEKAITVDNSIADSKNIAAIVASNLNEVLGRATRYSQIARSMMEGDSSAALQLNPTRDGERAYLRIAVFDQKGNLIESSANRRSEPELLQLVSMARSDQFGTLQDNQLIVGKPARDDRLAWRVPILIPFTSSLQGRGFFTAVIDLGYFLQLYKDVKLGDAGRIEVFTQDGYQLAELNGAMLSGGVDFSTSDFGKSLRHAEDGVINTKRLGMPLEDIGVLRRLQSYPLFVVVTHDQDYLMSRLADRHHDYLWRAIAVSIALVLLLCGLLMVATRQRRLYNVLTASEQEKRNLISQLEQEKTRALLQASHDYLTGVPNRRLFYEIAATEISRAKRSRKLYALFFLDLDKFKLINDTLGHAVGDLLLQGVARRLRESLREYDLLARLGGDEFVILISEMASEGDVARLAAKLVEVVRAPFIDLDGNDVEVSPSIGIALYPRDGQNVETLLTHADFAMYSAKSAGAATYRFFDTSLNASSARETELLGRFKRAIRDDEFCLHYQPRVELQEFTVVGLEALIRWQHPEHGLIYPNDFISLAENNDLIVLLGRWVIDAACRQLAAWCAQGLPVVPVAINVSSRQLKDGALLETVMTTLEKYQISPDLLEIEVTESCFIEDFDTANKVLEQLQKRGVKIALDDYGTGFSGLKNLKNLPIYAIKIDRSFIRDIRNDNSDAVIVASTISLAHNLGLKVVAEGVESKEQLVHLKTAGCDQVQGFYFQRPVAASEMGRLLQRRKFRP
ncbi:putative bifunctional diguanylate cyclase/phosphodiesterase [Herminiimonas aquatilis]|uniref:Bifunctional diguanylate cyclase/phosphodiesterase n=1 Tax=Herminiimonas aquatilis TaxID=345342 RepID=A0ABW2J9M7_9BURK